MFPLPQAVRPRKGTSKMRILTWNIHDFTNRHWEPAFPALLDALKQIDADVVGLNEVVHPQTVPGATLPPLEELAAQLGMHYVFGPCKRWDAHLPMPNESYGNALLSKWPLIASAAHHLTPVDGKEQRGLLEGRMLLDDGRPFTVYVTHLDHTSEPARATQFRAARTWLVRDRNRPHVLMGDLNAIDLWDFTDRAEDLEKVRQHPTGHNLLGEEKGVQVLPDAVKAGYVDLFRQFHAPGADSHLPSDIALRIDFILASQSLAPHCTRCDILAEYDHVSDHRPVIAEFDW